jgi:AAA domain
MKLVKLSVERFQCIESAEVEFGPGLNVLYGPNDLGKTSLAWAIRAVLLLQHSSAAHERFVSWHGGGEPAVTLTLTDDADRYWRIKKVFAAGTAGRSRLESSKDGRCFTQEATGRAVDDKIRELLRWGVPKPGGRGSPHGLPTSFLTHVLLADQDDVRKILFDVSLSKDPDESGRQRLTEALGALAQDPLFKAILDRAQVQVDRAYTATGRQKRGADSPFIEVSKRLEDLQKQRDELRQKEKDTDLAEKELQAKNAERDRVSLDLEQAREMSTRLEAALIAQERRDVLVHDLAAEKDRLETATKLKVTTERTRADLTRHEHTIREAGSVQEQLRAHLARLESERGTCRAAVEDVTTAASNTPSPEQRARLDSLRDAIGTATRTADAAENEHAELAALAKTIMAQVARHRETSAAEVSAVRALETARSEDRLARDALENARDRLRDATSGDQARARELRAADLAKRGAELDATEADLGRLAERVAACERLAKELAITTANQSAAKQELEATRKEAADSKAALATLDHDIAFLERVLRYDDLVAARGRLSEGRQAQEKATQQLDAAATLRAEAGVLREGLRHSVPDLATIDRLQQLHQALRLGEARLGAVTVALRPARSLRVAIEHDGVRQPAREIATPTVLSATGRVVIAIEGVGDLDVSGGDELVRAEVGRLQVRWQVEGAPVLRACQAAGIEELVQFRRDTDRTLARIDDRLRDAQMKEQLAQQVRPDNLDQLASEVTSIETELYQDVGVLAAHHANAKTSVRRETADRLERLKRERISATSREQAHREGIARHEARIENTERAAQALRAKLEEQGTSFDAPWEVVRDRTNSDRERIHVKREELCRLTETLASESGKGEAAARTAITAAEARTSRAASELTKADRAAATARDARSMAGAALQASIDRARTLDAGRAWVGALALDAPTLDLGPWRREAANTQGRVDALHMQLETLRNQVDTESRARQAASIAARNALKTLEEAIEKERDRLDAATERERTARLQVDRLRAEDTRVRVELASIDTVATVSRIAALKHELETLPPARDRYSPEHKGAVESRLVELTTQQDDLDRAIERARGGLEKVGGAVVREQAREIEIAIDAARAEHRKVEVEFGAWKMLVEALRASEATEAQHLGRTLAAPVSDRFRKLTGGRYGAVELDAQLTAQGLHVAGQLREISALSAGTQDQLATLLRLCIAEQVKSSIVLDDHLSQSDARRVAWFNDALRTAATGVQIIVITCRPGELLPPDEFPAEDERMRIASGGLTRAIALERSIRRFAK